MSYSASIRIDAMHGLSAEAFNQVMSEGLNTLAQIIHKELLSRIDSGESGWPPLSQVTKWLKGSDQMLVDSGDFRKAIEYTVDGNKAYIGILNPRGSKDQDMELIARVIEGGAVIPVTPKMRGWFAAKGHPLRLSTVAIVIPARPVFAPSLTALDDRIEEVFSPLLDREGVA